MLTDTRLAKFMWLGLIAWVFCPSPSHGQTSTQVGWSAQDGWVVAKQFRQGDNRLIVSYRTFGGPEIRFTGAAPIFKFRLYPGIGLGLNRQTMEIEELNLSLADNFKPFWFLYVDGRTTLRLSSSPHIRRDFEFFGQMRKTPGYYIGQALTYQTSLDGDESWFRGGQLLILPLREESQLRIGFGQTQRFNRRPGLRSYDYEVEWAIWFQLDSRLDRLR